MSDEDNITQGNREAGHRIVQVRNLGNSAFILRFTRGAINFRAGQHIIVGLKGEIDQREYSVYSSEQDDHLEILLKEVKEGNISVKLKNCKPGDMLEVDGPFGSFGIEPSDLLTRKHVFIATGTGISPFHSIIRSYPGIDYMLIHGTRYANEAWEKQEFDPDRYFQCCSADKCTGHNGRVTGFLSGFKTTPEMLFYLCGNGSMIYEVKHILQDKGVSVQKIFSEIYF